MTFKKRLNNAADQVLARLRQCPNERLLSWDHCHKYFHALPPEPTEVQTDQMALHLAFYLASYGMYRGSTMLLKKDYRFLIPVVKKLLEAQFRCEPSLLSVADATTPERARLAWKQVQTLEAQLRDMGIGQKDLHTLSTKILLGTWVTVPAFDSAFKKALKRTKLGSATFSESNFFRVFTKLHKKAGVFQRQVNRFHDAGWSHYPAIRVIDALLWQIGGKQTKKTRNFHKK